MSDGKRTACLYAFDLLFLERADLRPLPELEHQRVEVEFNTTPTKRSRFVGTGHNTDRCRRTGRPGRPSYSN